MKEASLSSLTLQKVCVIEISAGHLVPTVFARLRCQLFSRRLMEKREARLRALESTTADDFLVVVAIKRQLGTRKRYLKISADDARRYQAMRTRAFRVRQKAKAVLVGESVTGSMPGEGREGQSRRPFWGLAAVRVAGSSY
jgi:hypothetical protein